jgi:hypothetical protein
MLSIASGAAQAQASDSSRFDGRWAVTLDCPNSSDGALPFMFEFTADVTNATLHGEHGTAGASGWMSLDGTIQSDGTAALHAHGITGPAKFNIGQTTHGVPYDHTVNAHFDDATGTGNWVTTRTCDFRFRKI